MAAENDPHSVPFSPPKTPVEVHCLHCGNVYMSSEMRFVPRIGQPMYDGDLGDWVCAAPGCDACGFGFDILPTDEDYSDENGGWMECDDDFDEELENSSVDADAPDPPSFDPINEEADYDFLTESDLEPDDEPWSPAQMDWLERSGYPYARRWNIVFHFEEYRRESSRPNPMPRRDDGRAWDDDIPF